MGGKGGQGCGAEPGSRYRQTEEALALAGVQIELGQPEGGECREYKRKIADIWMYSGSEAVKIVVKYKGRSQSETHGVREGVQLLSYVGVSIEGTERP